MNLVADRLKSAVGEAALAEAVRVDDVILEWATAGLKDAVREGRMGEVPFYKKALAHVASVKPSP